MKGDIDDILKVFFQSEEWMACRILGRRRALARIQASCQDRGALENGQGNASPGSHVTSALCGALPASVYASTSR